MGGGDGKCPDLSYAIVYCFWANTNPCGYRIPLRNISPTEGCGGNMTDMRSCPEPILQLTQWCLHSILYFTKSLVYIWKIYPETGRNLFLSLRPKSYKTVKMAKSPSYQKSKYKSLLYPWGNAAISATIKNMKDLKRGG